MTVTAGSPTVLQLWTGWEIHNDEVPACQPLRQNTGATATKIIRFTLIILSSLSSVTVFFLFPVCLVSNWQVDCCPLPGVYIVYSSDTEFVFDLSISLLEAYSLKKNLPLLKKITPFHCYGLLSRYSPVKPVEV